MLIVKETGRTFMDIKFAEKKAQRDLSKQPDNKIHQYVLLKDKTQVKPFGWVFFAAPKKYLETNNPSYLVPGLGPPDCGPKKWIGASLGTVHLRTGDRRLRNPLGAQILLGSRGKINPP